MSVDTKPRSVWDRIQNDRMRPFTWATPAPLHDGTVPQPWRVAHAQEALAWLKTLHVDGTDLSDLYTTYESDLHKGRLQIFVGLRDNRDPVAHSTRLHALYNWIRDMGNPAMPMNYNGRLGGIYLVDDLQKDVLRGRAASLRADVIRLAHENEALRPHLLPMITSAKKNDQKGYEFYVVVNQKIESGWEYKDDANDQKKEVANSKVFTRKTLVSQGLDPADNNKWMTQSDKQGSDKQALMVPNEGKDNTWGRGYVPLPKKLHHLPRFGDIFRRVLDHKVWPDDGMHMIVVPSTTKLSLFADDLTSLIRVLGLVRIQVNDPGQMSFYFMEKGGTWGQG